MFQSGVTLSKWRYEGVGQARQVLEILYIKTVKRISEKGSPGGVQQPSERCSTCCHHQEPTSHYDYTGTELPGPVLHNQDENCIVHPESKFQLKKKAPPL